MRREIKARLISHRTVAKLIDVDTETLRDWVAAGEFPEPRSTVSQTWLYDINMIEHFIETGKWPEGTKFKAGEGKGRGAEG